MSASDSSVLRPAYPEFFRLLDEGKLPISYDQKFREFFIISHTSSFRQLLKYCPWSGRAFPKDLREEWFAETDALGLDIALDNWRSAPIHFHSEAWWKARGL